MDQKYDPGLVVPVGVLTALLVINAGLCYRNTQELNERAGWVSHTLEVEEALLDLKTTVTNAESSVRAYLITGDNSSLGPYQAAASTMKDKLEGVAKLTEDNPKQQGRIPFLQTRTLARMDELAETKTVREKRGFEAARTVMLTGEGQQAMDALLTLVGEMVQAEKDLLVERQARTDRAYLTALFTGLLAAFFGLVAVGVVVWLGQRLLVARLRTAALLRQERERLRVSLTSIGDAVIATDTEGRVTFLNPTAQSLTGWGGEEAQGQLLETVFRIINESTRQAAEQPVARVIREGVVVGLANHTILVAKDGTERPIEDSAAPIKADDGRIVGVILVFHDVTEKRRQAKALEERTAELTVAKSHLEAVFQSVAEGITVFDRQANIVFFNDAGARIAGFASSEEMLRNLSDFAEVFEFSDAEGKNVPVDRWPASRVLRGESFTEWECHGRRRDTGQEWELSFSGSPVRDKGGQQVLSVIVTRDITGRKRAEAALRESEEQFRTLADSIPQLAWTARPDGAIYWYNHRWYEYTGTTSEQMEGWGWQSVHDPEQLPKVLERWQASLSTGEPFDMVLPLKGKDGVFQPFLTRVMPLRNEKGRILKWFGTNTDISEIREMHAKLEEVDRRKDQFVMMLAHELRNPLAPIRNGLQLLQASGADRQMVEQARAIMARQIGHMSRIIEDLLDVSRLMRGRVELRPVRLDLGQFVRTALEDQRHTFEAKGLSLDTDLPELPVWVNADPTRLTQMFDNLIQNSIKFSDRGGRVTVRVRADVGRQQVLLNVRDSGVGIEPGLLPHLFETFSQADRSLDRSKGGLGLGLSLVKGLVELHGGTVEARSEGPGCGAEFLVRLPLVPEPAAVTEIPAVPKRASKQLRVLVVEDNRDAADSLKMLLELFGYEVTVAYTGPSGVETAREWRPDVILCDIGLPGLNGYEVARELRQDPATAKARMIAVTGYGSDEDRQRSQAAGFDGHLTKPADPTVLQDLLARS